MTPKSRLLIAASACLVGAIAGPAFAAEPDGSGTAVGEVVVTAQRLDAARATIQPQTGASTYAISAQAIQAMPAATTPR